MKIDARQIATLCDFADELCLELGFGATWNGEADTLQNLTLTILELKRKGEGEGEELTELLRRNRAIVGCATRVRKKADEATGAVGDSSEERNEEGRSAGMEGAVDLLIAKYCGLLAKIGANWHRLHCFSCGKVVSSLVPSETVLRAVALCPECIEESHPDMWEGFLPDHPTPEAKEPGS